MAMHIRDMDCCAVKELGYIAANDKPEGVIHQLYEERPSAISLRVNTE